MEQAQGKSSHRSEFLKRRQVCARIGYEKSWLWDAIKHKGFPAPIHIGGSARWVGEQIEQWMRDQIERSQGLDASPPQERKEGAK